MTSSAPTLLRPPSFALFDLSVVDSRFAPALLAAHIAHLLEAWEGAVTGSEAPLGERASADARVALPRPCPGFRLIVRDVVVKSWEPTRLDLSQDTPAVELALAVDAVHCPVNDAGSVVAGNPAGPQPMTMTWTRVLTDAEAAAWRLVATTDPAAAIPGTP